MGCSASSLGIFFSGERGCVAEFFKGSERKKWIVCKVGAPFLRKPDMPPPRRLPDINHKKTEEEKEKDRRCWKWGWNVKQTFLPHPNPPKKTKKEIEKLWAYFSTRSVFDSGHRATRALIRQKRTPPKRIFSFPPRFFFFFEGSWERRSRRAL